MQKQDVAHTHSGVLFGLKKAGNSNTHTTAWMNLEDTLSEKSQTQQDQYCGIPHT